MLRLEVKKQYGERTVLDCELSLEEGKVTVLIGSNGSGKSTLLSALAGQLPFEGRIEGTKGLDVCFMPQSSYAFDLSVRRNIMLAVPAKERYGKKQREECRARVDGLMDTANLSYLQKKNAARLSGGETQKVALCRCLVRKHDLLILDEPTSAMDMASSAAAEKMLSGYCALHRPTVLLATHSINQAERLADRVIVLKEGKIIGDGPPSEVLNDSITWFR